MTSPFAPDSATEVRWTLKVGTAGSSWPRRPPGDRRASSAELSSVGLRDQTPGGAGVYGESVLNRVGRGRCAQGGGASRDSAVTEPLPISPCARGGIG